MATHTYRPGGTAPAGNDGQLSVNPMFARHGEATSVPKHRLPDGPMDPATAYQAVHDHLMLDGNALNLATFVTTWMEPEADPLMSECFDKNVIDKDEYPQTAELELRCVSMLARLWNPVLHVLTAGPRGLPADPAGVSQHGDLHIRPDRGPGAVPPAHPRRRTAAVRVHPAGRRHQLHVFDVSAGLREGGWQMPAYTFPANREGLAAMRVVVRNGTGREMADLLLDDMAQLLPRLQGQAVPARGPNAGSFDHASALAEPIPVQRAALR
jgi:glutamate/tyrosine decarboxylase-like PLP-dependent enzyme